ncbi:MAG TPA: 2-amino-4-hydroxy-6-hydroxymethyldihydropteridine diphosphokinase [Rikenellaceae bacterium]|nr:MAG: 2-amino-4-hydroxy-6-hydroxymethyldihydropteridine diphosphokinase [Bacteroidetes bacterium GWE2_40_15]HBZ26603.1 2-amino-4-hydroxy-6-hydroxymethyldihydropteridine diphosphokinase [Rikenellaceae bacterium]
MNRAALLLGSNKGDSQSILKIAVAALSSLATPQSKMVLSSVYESEPWGFDAERWFLNMAIIMETPMSARELLGEILEIETKLGRVRDKSQNRDSMEVRSVYQSREIDIDIILFNDEIINEESLIVPHPRMHLRRFVLEPIVQIAPDYIHPVFNLPLYTLLEKCKDTSVVRRH